MKKKIFFVIVLIIVSISLVFHYYFMSMSHLPEGELIGVYDSEFSECTVNIYRCNGGATVDYSIRGEVIYKNDKTKNIYWAYHEQDADVKWIDDQTVCINGRTLNIYNDIYDWRK